MGASYAFARVPCERLTRLSYYSLSFGLIVVKYTGSENGLYRKGAYGPPI
jgi:hypothetical protein